MILERFECVLPNENKNKIGGGGGSILVHTLQEQYFAKEPKTEDEQ